MSAGDLLPVTQADRDAAAAFYGPHLARPGEVLVTAHMRAGKIDDSPLIQAFAHHRLAASNSYDKAIREALEAVRACRKPAAKIQSIHGEVEVGASWSVSGLTRLLPQIDTALERPANGEWLPIETAPKDEWLIGRKVGWTAESINAPFFVGKLYDLRAGALIDPSKGRWVACDAYQLLSAIPSPSEGDA